MVVSTANNNSLPHSAAVYVVAVSAKQLFFITKRDTRKLKDIDENPNVSITIVNPHDNSTLQAHGKAHTINNAAEIEMVMEKMTKVHAHSPDWLPPLAKFRAGPYEVVEIKLSKARLATFKGAKPGDEAIFKEI